MDGSGERVFSLGRTRVADGGGAKGGGRTQGGSSEGGGSGHTLWGGEQGEESAMEEWHGEGRVGRHAIFGLQKFQV